MLIIISLSLPLSQWPTWALYETAAAQSAPLDVNHLVQSPLLLPLLLHPICTLMASSAVPSVLCLSVFGTETVEVRNDLHACSVLMSFFLR